MTDVRGCHAIVTGGSSGIGWATARLLAERGSRVSLVARDPVHLASAAQRIAGEVPDAVVVTAAIPAPAH
jgi:3-dehydrosphinganine reductase